MYLAFLSQWEPHTAKLSSICFCGHHSIAFTMAVKVLGAVLKPNSSMPYLTISSHSGTGEQGILWLFTAMQPYYIDTYEVSTVSVVKL